MNILKKISLILKKIKYLVLNDQKEELLNIIQELEKFTYNEGGFEDNLLNAAPKDEFLYSLLFHYSKDPILIIKDFKIVDCNLESLKVFGEKTKENLLENQFKIAFEKFFYFFRILAHNSSFFVSIQLTLT